MGERVRVGVGEDDTGGLVVGWSVGAVVGLELGVGVGAVPWTVMVTLDAAVFPA